MLQSKLFDMKVIANIDELYAHTKNEGLEKEFLIDHLDKTIFYFEKIYTEKNLDSIFNNIAKTLFNNNEKALIDFNELALNAVYMHDIGKINVNFQNFKMSNPLPHLKKIRNTDSNHSMLSAVIYYCNYMKIVKKWTDPQVQQKFRMLLLLNSYVISKHHSNFDSLADFQRKFEKGFKDYSKNSFFDSYSIPFENAIAPGIEGYFKSYKWMKDVSKELYIYTRLLFSTLCAADYYATGEFMNNKPVKDFGVIKNLEKFVSKYQSTNVYQSIQKQKEKSYPFEVLDDVKDINILRSEMFLEAEKNLEIQKDEDIFYLEAPTGSGKTNMSINLSLKLLEQNEQLNKIIYVFPFNTLVEQTYSTLVELFEFEDDIAVLNSITPMLERKERSDEEILRTDYEQTVLDNQFLHYPIVLTSHVNFFAYLFSTKKEQLFALSHLANSVIILDEIQSYRNNIWKEMIGFLQKYASTLNIKIIIMSATLPRLGNLIGASVPTLIEDRERYFSHPLFKNRVVLDYSLLEIEEFELNDLVEKVEVIANGSNKNILIEFITKKTAAEFFNLVKEKFPTRQVELITGDDHKAERKRVINLVKKSKNFLLIATQVIEAGVDIDMDIGFKNISTLDGEEQFLGRINRSCKNDELGKVYFFQLDVVNTIYKKDLRVNNKEDYSLKNPDFQHMLLEKDFINFYEKIFNRIEVSTTKKNSKNLDEFYKECVDRLNFLEVQERFRLIDEKDYEITVFVNSEIILEDGTRLIGEKVWEEYKQIVISKGLSFAERKVKLSVLNEKMNYFLYQINFVVNYQDTIGGIFYIRNGGQCFTEGKFDRELVRMNSMFA
ncbi:CRISPR-associated helicase Cas3' [Psychrobacillus sp. NPDC093180]|uniref:CRISPR-associated helicase Cas3' n=1 Tax=Psychrobacillus sp. NPDC093180 TaxID=3364489 RepID=UPI003803B274